MRENCTPGSVRGPSGNWRSYRDGGYFPGGLMYLEDRKKTALRTREKRAGGPGDAGAADPDAPEDTE